MEQRYKMKIIFIAGLLSQPRCIKRVTSFAEHGYECEVYGYNRGGYDVNKYPDGIKVHVLSEMRDGKDYLKKLLTCRKDIRRITSTHKNENVVFYTFMFIGAWILLNKKTKYIYEISDILYAYPKFSKVEKLLRVLDKRLINKSVATIMTSEGFKHYFAMDSSNIVVIPNKVSTVLKGVERVPLHIETNNIRFGFVGAIRYDSIIRFAEVIGKYYPCNSFEFYGNWLATDTKEQVERLTQNYFNIHFHGAYKSPQDLPGIYSELDVVVACYDVNSTNERIAEPNKLYESCLFCKPIVVSADTYLAERVNELNCGFSIDASNEESIKSFIAAISVNTIEHISKVLSETNSNEYYDNESELFAFLKDAIKSKP